MDPHSVTAVVTTWLAQAVAPSTGMADVLLGLGLPGVVVLALGITVRALYNRIDEDRAYHRDRADRVTEELRALNAAIRDDYIRGLAAATEAISDFIKADLRGR